MFFSNYYVDLNKKLNINTILPYKNIKNKFILLYINKKNHLYDKNNFKQIYSDALIYSNYYLYWKTHGCIYSDDIMNILYDIEFI